MENDAVLEDAAGEGGRAHSASSLSAPLPVRRSSLPSETEKTKIARLAAQGMEVGQIASALRLKVSGVGRFLNSKRGKALTQESRAFLELTQAEHQSGLVEMLPKVRQTISHVMDFGTARERSQAAQWVHEAVVSKPTQKVDVSVNGRLEHDLSPVLETIGRLLGDLREKTHSHGLARVRSGNDITLTPQIPSGEEPE